MQKIKYRIYRLSARAVMGYGQRDGDWFSFSLNKSATEQCKINALHEQEDNALFYQIMDELHGGKFSVPADGKIVTDLSDVIFYMDFSGIFDRTSQEKKYADRLLKAKSMFRPEGITLDFGSGKHRYLAFERSGSMSRKAVLSFIREDLYAPVTRRITMDLTIGMCQLSKLYAYNGLMMSSGKRIDDIGIDKAHRVIVIDKLVKELNALLEEKVKGKYALLTDEDILELLVNRKWYYSIFEGIKALYVTASHNMANRIIELAERYEYDLPFLAKEAEVLEAKVKAHLERMGFVW